MEWLAVLMTFIITGGIVIVIASIAIKLTEELKGESNNNNVSMAIMYIVVIGIILLYIYSAI